MLRLLLSLSSSQNQSFDFISNDNQQRIQNNNISWNELVKEEPLEGDHWKTWSDYSDTESAASNDGDSDKEQFELDRDQLQKQYNNNNNSSSDNVIQPKLQKADYIEQMELDTRQDNNALEYLVSQQYWREQRDDIVPGKYIYILMN
jgi:hypothetical protein